MGDDINSSNIHNDHLANFYQTFKNCEMYERYARQGCANLAEFMEIPFEQRDIIIPQTQYKNLKIWMVEFDILLDQLRPTIKENYSVLKGKLHLLIKMGNETPKMIKEYKQKNYLVRVDLLPQYYNLIEHLLELKSELILLIEGLLYIDQGITTKKKW